MITLVPEYYSQFRCIAGDCTHSCCIGWEIDIDSHTYEMYTTLSGELGDKLRHHTRCTGGTAHFVLGADDRCPFLDNAGLCEIIIKMGEGALCDICADHPRFCSCFSSHTELGLGMCCSEAARIILSHTKPFSLVPLTDTGDDLIYTNEEKDFFDARERLLEIVADRTLCFNSRITKIENEFSAKIPDFSFSKWCDIYLSLERLDLEWTVTLGNAAKKSAQSDFFDNEKMQYISEQLLTYFIYRHLPDSLYDGMLSQRISFCLLSFYIIKQLFLRSDDKSFENFVNICRMYSSEIEYSTENIDKLMLLI